MNEKRKSSHIVEANVWDLQMGIGIAITVASIVAAIVTHSSMAGLGIVGGAMATLNAWAAKWFLIRWKPEALER